MYKRVCDAIVHSVRTTEKVLALHIDALLISQIQGKKKQ